MGRPPPSPKKMQVEACVKHLEGETKGDVFEGSQDAPKEENVDETPNDTTMGASGVFERSQGTTTDQQSAVEGPQDSRWVERARNEAWEIG